ncbi:uncharacterized protein LOC141718224 [Apium graveolens]|uniref:uncharacterized protein LOC141718224 n=1 Tax=Apium graveolens TaxID=4045 RepID=UPI003D7B0480
MRDIGRQLLVKGIVAIVYTDTQFCRRFQMRISLFLRIEEAVTTHDNYFTQRIDAVGMRGLSTLQKVTAALRMLAYGTAADAVDDYVRIDSSHMFQELAEGRGPEVRKDVEMAFGVLQSRFAMIRGPSRFWDVSTMIYIMTTCIILHNMIIEDERELHTEEENFDTNVGPNVTWIPRHGNTLPEFIQMHQQIRDKQARVQLLNDLVEHLWQIHGGDISKIFNLLVD